MTCKHDPMDHTGDAYGPYCGIVGCSCKLHGDNCGPKHNHPLSIGCGPSCPEGGRDQ